MSWREGPAATAGWDVEQEQTAVVVTVSGRVQGVGFRYTTQRVASGMGLDGWVRNRPDGTVEAWAQGGKEVVDRFLEFVEQGPPAARVTDIDTSVVAPDPGLSGFKVRY